MFFKRFSKGSRQNSESYVDDYDQESPVEREFKPQYGDSPRNSASQHNTLIGHSTPPATSGGGGEKDMFHPRSMAPADPYSRPHVFANGSGELRGTGTRNSMSMDPAGKDGMPAPDLLTRAFNEAVKPYQEKIDNLENQLADLQSWVEQLEKQRDELHAWIDKRGLRPGKNYVACSATMVC